MRNSSRGMERTAVQPWLLCAGLHGQVIKRFDQCWPTVLMTMSMIAFLFSAPEFYVYDPKCADCLWAGPECRKAIGPWTLLATTSLRPCFSEAQAGAVVQLDHADAKLRCS